MTLHGKSGWGMSVPSPQAAFKAIKANDTQPKLNAAGVKVLCPTSWAIDFWMMSLPTSKRTAKVPAGFLYCWSRISRGLTGSLSKASARLVRGRGRIGM